MPERTVKTGSYFVGVPYILRRLKSDRQIIADLPDKTELKAYCPLTRVHAALIQYSV